MNHHHHPRQLASNNPEQDFSLPPSASTANNPFENSVPASRCGGSLPNMTLPYSPDRHHFPKSPSHSPAQVLPPLPPPRTLHRSVSDLNHSPSKTSSRSSTSDFHFSTDLDTPYSKGLSRMNHHHPGRFHLNTQNKILLSRRLHPPPTTHLRSLYLPLAVAVLCPT